MNYARNYKNLLNFVKVMPKVLVVPFFFPDTVYYTLAHNFAKMLSPSDLAVNLSSHHLRSYHTLNTCMSIVPTTSCEISVTFLTNDGQCPNFYAICTLTLLFFKTPNLIQPIKTKMPKKHNET